MYEVSKSNQVLWRLNYIILGAVFKKKKIIKLQIQNWV